MKKTAYLNLTSIIFFGLYFLLIQNELFLSQNECNAKLVLKLKGFRSTIRLNSL